MKTLIILVIYFWTSAIGQEDTVGIPFVTHLHLARAKALHDLAIAKAKLHRTPNLLLQANPDYTEPSSHNNGSVNTLLGDPSNRTIISYQDLMAFEKQIPYTTSKYAPSLKDSYDNEDAIFNKNLKFPNRNFQNTKARIGDFKHPDVSDIPRQLENLTEIIEQNKDISESILRKQNQSPFSKSKDFSGDSVIEIQENKSVDQIARHFITYSNSTADNDINSKQKLQLPSAVGSPKLIVKNNTQQHFIEEPLPITTDLKSKTASSKEEVPLGDTSLHEHGVLSHNYPSYESRGLNDRNIFADDYSKEFVKPIPFSIHSSALKRYYKTPNEDQDPILYTNFQLQRDFQTPKKEGNHFGDQHENFYTKYTPQELDNHTSINEIYEDISKRVVKNHNQGITESDKEISSQTPPTFKLKNLVSLDTLTEIEEDKSVGETIPRFKIHTILAAENKNNSEIQDQMQQSFQKERLSTTVNRNSSANPKLHEQQTAGGENKSFEGDVFLNNYARSEDVFVSSPLVDRHKVVSKPLDPHMFQEDLEDSTDRVDSMKMSKDNRNLEGYISVGYQNERPRNGMPLHFDLEITPNQKRLQTKQNPDMGRTPQSFSRLNGDFVLPRKDNYDTEPQLNVNDTPLGNQLQDEADETSSNTEESWNAFQKINAPNVEVSHKLHAERLLDPTFIESQQQKLFQITTEETYNAVHDQHLFPEVTSRKPDYHHIDPVKISSKGYKQNMSDNLRRLEDVISSTNSTNTNVRNLKNLALNATYNTNLFGKLVDKDEFQTTLAPYSAIQDRLFFSDITSRQPIRLKENMAEAFNHFEDIIPDDATSIKGNVSHPSNSSFDSIHIPNTGIFDNFRDEDILPLLTAHQNATNSSLERPTSTPKTEYESTPIPLEVPEADIQKHINGASLDLKDHSRNQNLSTDDTRNYHANDQNNVSLPHLIKSTSSRLMNNSQYPGESLIFREQLRQQVSENKFQKHHTKSTPANEEKAFTPSGKIPTDFQKAANYKDHSQNRNFDYKFKDDKSWRQGNQPILLPSHLEEIIAPPLRITILQAHPHEVSNKHALETSAKTYEEPFYRLKHYIHLIHAQNEENARNYHHYANIKSKSRESEIPTSATGLEYPERVGNYLLHFPSNPRYFGERFRREIRTRKSKKVAENGKRHPLPLISLLLDPKAKLDVQRTMKNFGTVTKNSLQDEKAPVQHVKGMISSARNAVLATMRIPPEDMIVPSKYKIIDRNILKGRTPMETRLGEPSQNANGSMNQVFQRVGSMMRQSVESGQAALQHFSDIAHNARKVFSSTRESIPKLFFPYIKVPEIIKEENPKKLTVITPRFADIGEESPNSAEDDYLKVGKVMDALGLSHPTDEKIGTMKFVIRPKDKQPVLQSRFGDTSVEDDSGQYVISNRLEGSSLDQSEVTEILEIFHTIKEVAGVTTLKELLSSMKDHLQNHTGSNAVAPEDKTEEIVEATWKIAKELTQPDLGPLSERNYTFTDKNSTKSKGRHRRTLPTSVYQDTENAEFAKFLAGYEIVSSINPEVFRTYSHQPLKIDHTKDVNLKEVQKEIKYANLLIVPPVLSSVAEKDVKVKT